jgi:Mrp family chromosome partitioning ATPase
MVAPASLEALRWPEAPAGVAEHFQLVALRLESALAARETRLVTIASPQPGDGRTTTAVHVAGALHLALGRRVLVVDGDLARPGLARMLRAGSFGAASQSGPFALAGAADSIASLARRLLKLRALYDYVLVDTPPIDRSADAAILGRVSDGVLLIVRAGRTRREKLDAALDALVDVPLVGCVLTDGDERGR